MRLDSGVVKLIEAPIPLTDRSAVVAVRIFPSKESAHEMSSALASRWANLSDCTFLITIDGHPIGWLGRGGVLSADSIQIGLFPTYEAAEAVLQSSNVEIERAVADPESVRRDEVLAEWLDWSLQCGEERREEMKRLHPAALEELSRRPKRDCTVRPPDPP